MPCKIHRKWLSYIPIYISPSLCTILVGNHECECQKGHNRFSMSRQSPGSIRPLPPPGSFFFLLLLLSLFSVLFLLLIFFLFRFQARFTGVLGTRLRGRAFVGAKPVAQIVAGRLRHPWRESR